MFELGAAAPGGRFVDYAPVHIVADVSLDRVAAALDRAEAEPIRYRPNIVLNAAATAPFQENGWTGRDLHVGKEIVLRVISPTPRCAVPTLAQGDAPLDPRITRVIGTLNRVEALDSGLRACLGTYARVIRGGTARVGDAVRLRTSEDA